MARIAFRTGKADCISYHGTEQYNPDDEHGRGPLSFMERPAEAHDLQRQRIADVREHCDYSKEVKIQYILVGIICKRNNFRRIIKGNTGPDGYNPGVLGSNRGEEGTGILRNRPDPVFPVPTSLQFIDNLRRKRGQPVADIPPHHY